MPEQQCESRRQLTSHSTEQFFKWEAEECKTRRQPSTRSRALGKGLEGKTKVSDTRKTAAHHWGASGMKGKTKCCRSYNRFYGLREGWLGIGTGDISSCRISFLKCAVTHRRHCSDG